MTRGASPKPAFINLTSSQLLLNHVQYHIYSMSIALKQHSTTILRMVTPLYVRLAGIITCTRLESPSSVDVPSIIIQWQLHQIQQFRTQTTIEIREFVHRIGKPLWLSFLAPALASPLDTLKCNHTTVDIGQLSAISSPLSFHF